jgi:hypothetical protein
MSLLQASGLAPACCWRCFCKSNQKGHHQIFKAFVRYAGAV